MSEARRGGGPYVRANKELTMRIFPRPLSGEKRKWKKIGGGEEGLVNRQFSRVLFSLGIRRENFVFANTTL